MSKLEFKFVSAKNAPVTDEELITDLQQVAKISQTEKVTQKIYSAHGKYDVTTVGRRFGTWNNALEAAKLRISNVVNIQDEKLFENIMLLWQHYGRQPRRAELTLPPSTISQGAYNRRFSSWSDALKYFVEYANAGDLTVPARIDAYTPNSRKTSRDPSLRLRFKVMLRDNFTCQHCGASPAKQLGVELHIDHIIPWSKGGETTLRNLQTLCSNCNLGKSNISEEGTSR